MKVSIALCTWNGERFLQEQLDSILAQSRPPDELVVCDDQSSDATADIVARFSSQAHFPVRFERNEKRLGPTQNFAKAIGMCSGDIIFFCDQDDYWLANKLERMSDVFVKKPEVGLVFSDGYIVDQDRERLGYTLWDVARLSRRHVAGIRAGRLFDLLIQRNVVTGAAAAFRASFRDTVLPIPREAMLHDAWIALILGGTTKCLALDEPLFEYRQHTSQQTGARITPAKDQVKELRARRSELRRQLAEAARSYESLRQHILDKGLWRSTDLRNIALSRKRDHLTRRAKLSESPVLKPLRVTYAFMRGDYFRYDRGWRALAEDILS